MFGRATITLGIGPHSCICIIHADISRGCAHFSVLIAKACIDNRKKTC